MTPEMKALYYLSGQHIPVLCDPQSNEVPPRVSMELPVFRIVTLSCH